MVPLFAFEFIVTRTITRPYFMQLHRLTQAMPQPLPLQWNRIMRGRIGTDIHPFSGPSGAVHLRRPNDIEPTTWLLMFVRSRETFDSRPC